MRTLCLERLDRLTDVLDRQGGSETIRQLSRRFSIWEWEVEQAAALGWVTIETRKPPTGRPSRIAHKLSQTPAAKLPPPRRAIGKEISIRHWNFGTATALLAQKWGRSVFRFTFISYTDAYLRSFPFARKRAAAAASASRLLRHPHVKAARAWWFAKTRREIPIDAIAPKTPREIYNHLRNARERT